MMFLRTAAVVVSLNLIVCAQKDPTASDAWAELRTGTVAIYATVNNPSMYDVYLVSGTSESAGKIELMNVDKPVTTITVPAYESVELKAGAMHVRLSDLKGEVKSGETVKLTLMTDGGISIPIAAVVK